MQVNAIIFISSYRLEILIYLFRCESVTIYGTLYKSHKCWMMVGKQQLLSGVLPQFGKLYDILIHGSEPNVLFVFFIILYYVLQSQSWFVCGQYTFPMLSVCLSSVNVLSSHLQCRSILQGNISLHKVKI